MWFPFKSLLQVSKSIDSSENKCIRRVSLWKTLIVGILYVLMIYISYWLKKVLKLAICILKDNLLIFIL